MRNEIQALTLAVLLCGSGGTAGAVTYVFDYETPFLPQGDRTAPPFSLIVSDSIWAQGGQVSIYERSDFYPPTPGGTPNQVPYDGVEVGWPEGFGSAHPCDPALSPGTRGSCRVASEWLGAINFELRAEFRGDLLVGSEFMFRWPGSAYRMTGDTNGLWVVDFMDAANAGSFWCGFPEGAPCGATGRFRRVPESGTLGLLSLGLAGLGMARRRRMS